MSVINKVLRDLDKRQGTPQARATSDDLGARIGTSSVDALELPQRPKPTAHTRWATVVVPGVLLAVLVAGGALWQNGLLDGLLPEPAPVATTAVPATLPPPAAAPTVVAAPAAEVLASPAEMAASAPESPAIELAPASRFESTLALPKDLQPAEPAKVPANPVKAPVAPVVTRSVASPPAPALAVAPAPVAVSKPAAASAPTPTELAQRQQQAGRDALAHAQSLWNAGSRESAIELLQQAVASTERAATIAPGSATTQTLVLLVRELGRMQLSDGRPGAVWETLTRLEPLLRNEPEMWALRANAAQRLGRHQDSVYAYMTALQSRPAEQRWLLGAAVSLAALGQIASSAEMAEKARNAGPISKEVQAYLRQMGVPLKD